MDTQSTQFDSHRFVKRLTKAGLSEEVAEILADEHTRLIVPGDVATKVDVGTVEARVGAVRAEMATQAEVDAKFDQVRAEMATQAEVDARFDQIRAEMATKAEVDARFDQIRAEMATKAEVDARFDQIRAEMATKAEVDRGSTRSEMATKAEVDARFASRAEMRGRTSVEKLPQRGADGAAAPERHTGSQGQPDQVDDHDDDGVLRNRDRGRDGASVATGGARIHAAPASRGTASRRLVRIPAMSSCRVWSRPSGVTVT